MGRSEELRARPLALEVRPLRVREHQARDLGALAHARLLVAPLRRGARQGDAGLGEAPLRPRRRQAGGAAPRAPATGAARRQDAARRAEALSAAKTPTKAQAAPDCRCPARPLSRTFSSMTGELSYAAANEYATD